MLLDNPCVFLLHFYGALCINSDAVLNLQTHDEYSQNELDVLIVSLTR